jgi:hypothetical protein
LSQAGELPPSGMGYADPAYIASLAEFGEPLVLPRSNAALLCRPIVRAEGATESSPPHAMRDAMGGYPLFGCPQWQHLGEDLDVLEASADRLVSITVVTDPFTSPSAERLRDMFDVVRPYKRHFVLDLSSSPHGAVARHHRKAALKGLRNVRVERCDPVEDLATWCDLYSHLVAKHEMGGIPAFSPAAFARQATIPGLFALKALVDDRVVAMHWYLISGGVAYAHLVAMHPEAYQVHADAAMLWTAIEMCSAKLNWLDLGAGSAVDASDGLSQFKAGWSSTTEPSFICGRVLDVERYRQLVATRPETDPPYFPEYRRGEFSKRPVAT